MTLAIRGFSCDFVDCDLLSQMRSTKPHETTRNIGLVRVILCEFVDRFFFSIRINSDSLSDPLITACQCLCYLNSAFQTRIST